jgi:hypothetical protein
MPSPSIPTGLATCSVHDDARTRPELAPTDIVLADSPEPGDLLIHERREAATRYRHLFTPDELLELAHAVRSPARTPS